MTSTAAATTASVAEAATTAAPNATACAAGSADSSDTEPLAALAPLLFSLVVLAFAWYRPRAGPGQRVVLDRILAYVFPAAVLLWSICHAAGSKTEVSASLASSALIVGALMAQGQTKKELDNERVSSAVEWVDLGEDEDEGLSVGDKQRYHNHKSRRVRSTILTSSPDAPRHMTEQRILEFVRTAFKKHGRLVIAELGQELAERSAPFVKKAPVDAEDCDSDDSCGSRCHVCAREFGLAAKAPGGGAPGVKAEKKPKKKKREKWSPAQDDDDDAEEPTAAAGKKETQLALYHDEGPPRNVMPRELPPPKPVNFPADARWYPKSAAKRSAKGTKKRTNLYPKEALTLAIEDQE